ncbi:MAG: hypothetical protein ACRDV4_04865 [Acidimicrobiales bacterium]
MWATAQRLLADGYERHEMLHMLASVVAGEVFEITRHEQRPSDSPSVATLLSELVRTHEVLARKRLGVAPSPGRPGRGTNYLRMLWKFDKVFNADRQYCDHLRPASYLMSPPPEQPAAAPDRAELYIHTSPRGV